MPVRRRARSVHEHKSSTERQPLTTQEQHQRRHVAVVVLGDVGRSPRMQYHSASLATVNQTEVDLIGYAGERCIDAVENNPHIHKRFISSPFAKAPRQLFYLLAPLKVLFQIAQLLWLLLIATSPPRAIIVQNPPSIPTLLVVWIACRLRGATMVIDWHNLGFTVLALSLHTSSNHWLVRIARTYERIFAQLADAHLCVTHAMRDWLFDEWGIQAHVLYDKPPAAFHPISASEKHELFYRLQQEPATKVLSPVQSSHSNVKKTQLEETLLTLRRRTGKLTSESFNHGDQLSTATKSVAQNVHSVAELRSDRPAVIVSSTSWTPDEDFNILLDALVHVSAVASTKEGKSQYPDFLVLVTGKGPLRAVYEARIAALSLPRVCIRTLWLSPSDYPTLIASADVGVSLHTSTSGLDLPMKVVDMFGCGIPVCAMHFNCLDELVKKGVNGNIFRDSQELATQLLTLFRGFPGKPSEDTLNALRLGVHEFQRVRWQDNWNAVAKPLFE